MTAIAIFVKTPGLSPVKTRLARGIGDKRAVMLYRQCATSVMEVVAEAAVGACYWALAEPQRKAKIHWPGADCIPQGTGGLGERMHRILTVLVQRHGSGLLLGADAPQIDARGLRQAVAWLEHPSPRRIIGPAQDGGFWTFGANHVPPIERWTRPTYSHPDTLDLFVDAIGHDAEWLHLPTLTDLDTEEDMKAVAAELRSLSQPLPSQLALVEALGGR